MDRCIVVLAGIARIEAAGFRKFDISRHLSRLSSEEQDPFPQNSHIQAAGSVASSGHGLGRP
jgi:hypothetical protein